MVEREEGPNPSQPERTLTILTHPLTLTLTPTPAQRSPVDAELVPLPYVYAEPGQQASSVVSRHYEALVEDALTRFG